MTMLFSLPTQVGLQVAILLSLDPGIPKRVQDLGATLGVSESLLQRVLREFKRSRLVRTVRGPCGGIVLARPANLITVWEILVAMEPVDSLEGCLLGLRRCDETNPCALHETWSPLRTRLLEEFRNRTLKQAAEEAERTHFAGFGQAFAGGQATE